MRKFVMMTCCVLFVACLFGSVKEIIDLKNKKPTIDPNDVIDLLQVQKALAPLEAKEAEILAKIQAACGKDLKPTWGQNGRATCEAPPKPPEKAK